MGDSQVRHIRRIEKQKRARRMSRVFLFIGVVAVALAVTAAAVHFWGSGTGGIPPGDGGSPGTAVKQPSDEGEGGEQNGDPGAAVQDPALLVLVNKTNAIGEEDKPEDLVLVKYFAKDRSESGRYMRREAAEHFNALSEAAAAAGYELVVTTAYRSYQFQTTLYNNYVANYGQAEADTFSARPGTSEHQTGLAADVSSPGVGYQLVTALGETAEGKWMAEHAHEFGFIIRFPLGKEDITGYQYEPWHLRYVGQPAADEIAEKGITLEEYLEKQK